MEIWKIVIKSSEIATKWTMSILINISNLTT